MPGGFCSGALRMAALPAAPWRRLRSCEVTKKFALRFV